MCWRSWDFSSSTPKTRIVHLREGGEGFDFLGFQHRWVRGTPRSRHLVSSPAGPHGRPPSTPATGSVRLTDRRRLLVRVEMIVPEVNRFLRGWAEYFRYGNSARPFDKITQLCAEPPRAVRGKRHKRSWRYGWKAVAYQSPDRLGLINLNGTIVAPRPNRTWRPGR